MLLFYFVKEYLSNILLFFANLYSFSLLSQKLTVVCKKKIKFFQNPVDIKQCLFYGLGIS